jgi:hypothetical protein
MVQEIYTARVLNNFSTASILKGFKKPLQEYVETLYDEEIKLRKNVPKEVT